MDKSEIRAQIDSIDGQILDLLARRISCAKEIGAMKSKNGEEVYVPSREKLVFKNLLEKNCGRIPEDALKAIYREIISASISVEKKLLVAYLGPCATFTQQAALKNFGSSVDYRPIPSIPDVFSAVERRLLKILGRASITARYLRFQTSFQPLRPATLTTA